MAGPTPVPSSPSYNFPYPTPYSIQQDLMQHLYTSLSRSQVTVIESPTGTGKSLSLICSSLTFLRDLKTQTREALAASIRAAVPEGDDPDWVVDHLVKEKLDELERAEKELEERLERIREKERVEASEGGNRGRGGKRKKVSHAGKGTEGATDAADDEFAPDPYYETEEDKVKIAEDATDNISPALREAMEADRKRTTKKVEEEVEPDVQKVYFASRTHSQLSQFVSELRKTTFGNPLPVTADPPARPIRMIPLGSRNALCINDDVRKKSGGNNEAMGDMCLELQKATGGSKAKDGEKEKKSGSKRCPYLPPASEPTKLNEFRDRALASVHDIEDIEDLGRSMHVCPYYGSRKAVKSAEVVTLPYNMIMSKQAREALGISLKDHVVIIDEAHNLIDSILSLHSTSITTTMLNSIRQAVVTYGQKFKSRFTGANKTYLGQFMLVLKGLSEFADAWAKEESGGAKGGKKEAMISVNDVLKHGSGGGALDQINLLKLDTYLRESRIARKIGGYVDSLAEEATAKGRQAIRANATRNLHHIQEFILSLANAERDGRVLLTCEPVASTPSAGASSTGTTPAKKVVTLKYMLLAPSESFRQVAEESRSVVLAGGTMLPMSDFRHQLFSYLPTERFSTFSCGHVVPAEHVATFAVSKGPSGVELEFKFDRRKDEKMLDDLGQSIVNVAQIMPKGVVVFVVSYEFLYQVQARWEKSGMLKRLATKKKIFWEPKSTGDVDLVLREYSAGNSGEQTGSILFAVVGAKLSEGINFADDMARTVIICGIPYPNLFSVELKERMNYLKKTSAATNGQDAGQVLYQNLAFRAVNQSIGRAIRSAQDWAAIILLDIRYQHPSKQAQLPGWLGEGINNVTSFGQLMKGLSMFVKARKGVK